MFIDQCKLSLQAECNVQGVLVSDPRDGVPSFGLVEKGRTESMEVTVPYCHGAHTVHVYRSIYVYARCFVYLNHLFELKALGISYSSTQK